MKLINFALLSVLVLLLVLAAPARTQTVNDVVLPADLNTALCINDWDKSLTILQRVISDTTDEDQIQQLVALRSELLSYRARNARVDQSDACAAALTSPGQSGSVGRSETPVPASSSSSNEPTSSTTSSTSSSSRCSSGNLAASGRCFSNRAAMRRHERSWEEGDRPASEMQQ